MCHALAGRQAAVANSLAARTRSKSFFSLFLFAFLCLFLKAGKLLLSTRQGENESVANGLLSRCIFTLSVESGHDYREAKREEQGP